MNDASRRTVGVAEDTRAPALVVRVKGGEAGEDEGRRAERELEDLTHTYVAQVDELLKHKEAELLEV